MSTTHRLTFSSFSRGIESITRKPLRGTKGTCSCGNWSLTVNKAPRSGGQDTIRAAHTEHIDGTR